MDNQRYLEDKNSQEYKYGFEFYNHNYLEFKEKFGEPKVGKEWLNFLYGKNDKNQILRKEKYDLYKLDDFLEKLKILCREYDVKIYGGEEIFFRCKDIDFEDFDINI